MSEPEPGLTGFFLSMFTMDTACLVQLHMCKTHVKCVTEDKSNFQDGSAAFQTTSDALQGKPMESRWIAAQQQIYEDNSSMQFSL